ncbi:MAG: hypothetical protein M1825_004988 [Sarcosagium campestre]|nr:MAG: hypothetical protein M1825_004988 [Sarcosagium campestre]
MATNQLFKDRKEVVLSRRQIEGLIASGRRILIVQGKVLKVDAWLKYHPGGDKAILHMIGRDATDEVTALHSAEALLRMDSFQIGRIEGRWVNFLPPIQGGTFRNVEQDDEMTDRGSESASQTSSRSVSPIFEAADDGDPTTRRRTIQKCYSAGRSSSSLSSVSSSEDAAQSQDDKLKLKLSALDARTQEELDLDLTKYPPLDAATQDEIAHKYRELDTKIRAAGLYQCNYTAYAWEVARYVLLFTLCLAFLRAGWYATSGVFLGLFWHQLVFTAHDAGHMGITHSFVVDTCIGIFIADFMGGLSLGWWKRNHNVHHIVTNSPEHDPDIEHMPFFAISHRFLSSLRSSYYERLMPYDAFARRTLPYQHYLYYPILALGRFNLYQLSWVYLLGGQAPRRGPAAWTLPLELLGQLFFWTWFGYGILYCSLPTPAARLIFILASHLTTAPLHLQITLSHFGMSTADLGPAESFPQKMLRTTMDVACPPVLDFLHGGLQFQAIHHLFPRIPRHNLRATQSLVADFCHDTGIPYALLGFVNGNKQVLGRMAEVGRHAAVLNACQKEIAAKGVLHAH